MKFRIETLTSLFLTAIILLGGCSGCGQEQLETPADDTVQDKQLPDAELQDDHDHSTAYTKVPQAPKGDDFFKTIQFLKTPPKLDRGHYRLPKNPYELPEYVEKYPDHFKIDERGFWAIAFPPEKARKLEAFSGWDLSEEEYVQQITEIVGDGLDTLTTAVFLLKMGGLKLKRHAKELFKQVIAEDPDNFHALRYYCGMIEDKNPKEGERLRRRLAALRPDSVRAQYGLAVFIASNHPEPREAIPYLEKVYHQKPFWYAPIYYLGITYYRLREYDKALAYLQASEVFTGPMDISSTLISVIQSTTRNTKRGVNK